MQQQPNRRRASDELNVAILGQLTELSRTVSDNHSETIRAISKVDTALQVHVAEDKAVAEDVEEHKERWKEVDRWKGKGFLLAIGVLLSSGAMGAWGKDLVETAKKLFG